MEGAERGGIGTRRREGKKYFEEEQALNRITKEAEERLAQRRAARAEAREMRLRELEKLQKEHENDDDDSGSACNSISPDTVKTPTIKSVPQPAPPIESRRSSEGSSQDEASISRDWKREYKEMEEKFRKAMISNAQYDNEKCTLAYEVEFLKDKITNLEEAHSQLTKEYKRKCSENEQLRKLSTKLGEDVKLIQKILEEREELIQEYGLVVVGEEENGLDDFDEEMDTLNPRKIETKKALLSQEASELLSKGAAKGSLDVRLKKFAEEKNELEDEVRRLKLELEDVHNLKRKENGLDSEKQKEVSKSINEYKFRLQKTEAEISSLHANVARLESLVTRYKAQSDELEKSEEELKTEKRRLQRELRDSQNRLEELEVTNSHLQRRFDKLKKARSTLLKDLSQDPV